MDRVKKFLKGWGQSLKGHTRKYKKKLTKELEILEKLEESALSADKLNRKSFIQAEMLKLSEDEENYWHKRSNSMWILKGDNNTAFFHRIANGKKRKNTIFSLKHNENVIEGDAALVEHATHFYKDLFGPSPPSGVHLDQGSWGQSELVTEQENVELEKPFSEAEIKDAVFSMDRNTSPGQTIFQLSSINISGVSLKMICLPCFMTFTISNWILVDLTMVLLHSSPKPKRLTT